MDSKYAKDLKAAFEIVDTNKGYLENLERLKAEGSVPKEQYDVMKDEYSRKIPSAESEIKAIKSQLERELEASKKELAMIRMELDTLSTRSKVGEIPLEKYKSADSKIRRALNKVELDVGEFENLLAAKCAADIWSVPGKRSGRSAPRL